MVRSLPGDGADLRTGGNPTRTRFAAGQGRQRRRTGTAAAVLHPKHTDTDARAPRPGDCAQVRCHAPASTADMDPRACRRHEGVTGRRPIPPDHRRNNLAAQLFAKRVRLVFPSGRWTTSSALALLRDRLRDPFGGFSGGVVAEFLPNVGAYDPVVEVVVRDNVNSSGCHRVSSAKRDDWQRIGDGAVTSVNFSAIEKSGKADSRQWVSARCAARWSGGIHKA